MKTICIIAQFPPPIHGLSKAVDTLYKSELSSEYSFEKVNITNNKQIISNLIKIKKSKADLFYFTISQSRIGNIRDLFIIKAIGGRKCLIHLHGGYYRKLLDEGMCKLQRKENYRLLKKLEGAIVLGPSLRYIFAKIIPDNKIYTVPNCVDNEYIISDSEFNNKIEQFPRKDVKRILFLSNFIKSKGYYKVLQLAKYERNRVSRGGKQRFRFDFAGKFFDKSEQSEFLDNIVENKLEDYVTYHGIVYGDAKRKLLKECDIFMLLTKYPKEGQPISILEAMGNGMVVFSTYHAGIPDIVDNTENGFLYEETDSKTIYDRLISLTDQDYLTIINNNRKKIMNYYNEETYIANLRNCFEQVLKGD